MTGQPELATGQVAGTFVVQPLLPGCRHDVAERIEHRERVALLDDTRFGVPPIGLGNDVVGIEHVDGRCHALIASRFPLRPRSITVS